MISITPYSGDRLQVCPAPPGRWLLELKPISGTAANEVIHVEYCSFRFELLLGCECTLTGGLSISGGDGWSARRRAEQWAGLGKSASICEQPHCARAAVSA
jgi:hypothetical protein